jgi:hypothetical protein
LPLFTENLNFYTFKFPFATILINSAVNGTSGEGCAQSLEERKSVAEAWVESFEETVVVQVGGGPLPDVLALV